MDVESEHTEPKDASSSMEVDEDRESRQLAVYGREAMTQLRTAHILISGLSGTGVEVAKNVVLANVGEMTLHDTKDVSYFDLCSHFFAMEEDVGKNRAEVSVESVRELNPSTKVHVMTKDLAEEDFESFAVAVFVDYPQEEAEKWNQVCREHNVAFIYVETRGLFGRCFCDFGPEFLVKDVNGEDPVSGIAAKIIANKEETVVQFVPDEATTFAPDDVVTFNEVEESAGLNGREFIVKKAHPFSLRLDPILGEESSVEEKVFPGGIVTQVKKPMTLKALPMNLASKSENFTAIFDMDLSKLGQSLTLHRIFLVVWEFVKNHGDLPAPCPRDVLEEVVAAGVAAYPDDIDNEIGRKLIFEIARQWNAQLNPVAAFYGGIAGQEVVKACSGKFHPIHQWMYGDYLECLPKNQSELPESEFIPLNSRYDSQVLVFGKSFQEKMMSMNLFLVGAGALGCELLKNFAVMGISCSESGKTWVTDDDHIEKSNLSRQFLFRNHMIKQSKSKMAAEVVQRMNPAFNIVAMQDRVSPLTEKVFDVPFWTGLTCVVNALDNIEARLYVDSRCIFFKKPMFDSGTLGPKFNTQVVLPFKTEHYGARRDPVEKQAPDCTLHNFPHNINHCLSWGRSEFIGNFEKVPGEILRLFELGSAKAYIEEKQKLHVGEREITQDAKAIHEFLVSRRCSTFAECVAWARERYEDYFVNRIHQLVFNLPEDATTSTGMKFWSPPKRFPHPVPFDPEDPIKMQFIVATANLMAKVSGIFEPSHPGIRDVKSVRKILDGVIIPEFVPFKEEIDTNEESENGNESMDEGTDFISEREKLLGESLSFRGPKLTPHPEEFEKDDDTNFHMDFISSVGNLRARNYTIGEVDKLHAKLIAGRIIPAIATATACATGLVCFELYKLINECELSDYRMGFCNLAIPTFTVCEPSEPAKNRTRHVEERPDPINYPDYVEEKTIHAYPEGFTIWDSIEVRMPLTASLGEFLKHFEEEHGIHPTSISVSPDPSRAILIYSDYMDRTKPRLTMTMHQIYEEIGHMNINERPYILPSIVFEDENGDDVETPDIVHYFQF